MLANRLREASRPTWAPHGTGGVGRVVKVWAKAMQLRGPATTWRSSDSLLAGSVALSHDYRTWCISHHVS
jgi:hypothetical protein